MTIFKTILKWFFGVFFLLFGIVGLFKEPFMAVVPILLGLFLIPKTYDIFVEKTNLQMSRTIRWIVVIAGFILIGYTSSISNTSKTASYDLIVANASKKIDEGKLEEARQLIKDAKSKYEEKENKATALEQEIEKSKDTNFAKETLAQMTDDEFEQLKSDRLSKSYLSQKTLNQSFIGLVKMHAPERAKIIKEIQEKVEKERAVAEAEQKAEELEEFNKNRKENIEKQFSAYDGSHRGLEKYIKDNMNDPDSYDHIETRYSDKGDHLFVITKFRGANAFGGKVINIIAANVDFEGNVLEIVSQN